MYILLFNVEAAADWEEFFIFSSYIIIICEEKLLLFNYLLFNYLVII